MHSSLLTTGATQSVMFRCPHQHTSMPLHPTILNQTPQLTRRLATLSLALRRGSPPARSILSCNRQQHKEAPASECCAHQQAGSVAVCREVGTKLVSWQGVAATLVPPPADPDHPGRAPAVLPPSSAARHSWPAASRAARSPCSAACSAPPGELRHQHQPPQQPAGNRHAVNMCATATTNH